MTPALTPKVLLDGLVFPEGPRWHDGRLWFSDMHAKRVVAVDEQGNAETIVDVPTLPSGLGWTPGGQLLIVSMLDRKLLRFDGSALHTIADLSALTGGKTNDMVVDATGRAYVGNFGFDYEGGEAPGPTRLVIVEPDGSARAAADDVLFPNGAVITPDGRMLILGETFGRCLTAFEILPDGSLVGRRPFAQFENVFPDGICLDADGAVWVASPPSQEFVRVRDGGEIVERIPVAGRGAYACMLGGSDGRTLFLCTAVGSQEELAQGKTQGAIETVHVAVPHAGLP
jgi:sugar lactone lactonase YvrE